MARADVESRADGESNQTQQPVDPLFWAAEPVRLKAVLRETIWAHQQFAQFPPQIAMEATQKGNTGPNTTYNPGVPSSLNSGINPATPIPLKFHPNMPTQALNSVWTFNGTIPPKLAIGRYGEPILFRHHNGLPADVTQNNGFGRNTITTHEHNGHHGAENDGFTGASSSPTSSTTITGRSCWRASPPSIPAPPIPGPALPTAAAASSSPGRLARDHEHALVPRSHVQLHLAERVQGQRRHVQHLQRAWIAATRPSMTA